jgi:hypothetical protein
MHEFFNLTPTSLSTVLLWYVLAIGGGVGFVGLTIRLQAQGKAALTRAAQSGRQSKRRKAPVVTPPPVDPLHHAPYWGRLALALYLMVYLLLISFGLGLAVPTVRIACQRVTDQRVDCTVREFVWMVAPSRHALIKDVRDVQEDSTRSSSTSLGGRPTGGSTYVTLTNGEEQTLTTQTTGVTAAIRQFLLTPAAPAVVVWGRPSWLELLISWALLLVALLVGGSWLRYKRNS